MAQVLGYLPPMSETETEFLAPDLSLTQPWLLWTSVGINQQVEDISLSTFPREINNK